MRSNKAAPLRTVKKTTDTSTKILPLTKKTDWLSFIENDAVLIEPGKDMYRKRLAITMLTWAEQETSIEINDFAIEMRMDINLFATWAKKYPDFERVYDQVKRIIGTRRRKGALLRKFDKDVVHRDEHVYEPTRHDINVYHNKLKKDIMSDNTTKVIVLNQLETGELVPISGKKENDVQKTSVLPSE